VHFSKLLFIGLFATTLHTPSWAQQAPPAEPVPPEAFEDSDEEFAEDEIVVTGQRLRGAVIGDIPPEQSLNPREIRAYGAGSIAELLDALSPQTRSGRGRGEGRPVVLVNGRRISGFSEIRDLPPEAIERVDILPEEVALKYGYRADQRVVNFVLRERFRAITTEAQGGFATAGGRGNYGADLNILRIDQAGRWNLDAEYQHATPLFESERDIIRSEDDPLFDQGSYRTLLPETDQFSLNGTLSRTLFGNLPATVNARLDANTSQGFLGLARDGGADALTRESQNMTGHLGIALNGDISRWRWSATGNYDRGRSETLTETGFGARDRAETWTQVANAELVANGSLYELPAGEISTTVRAGAETRGLRGETLRAGEEQGRELSRHRANVQGNIDIPIASRRRNVLAAIGDLTANANAEVEQLSDFGTLTTLGAGINWSPVQAVRLIASITDEDGAPSMQQLGDPTVLTPNVRVFDFVRGETVDISRIEGGNPELRADNRRVMKLGLNVRPWEERDLSLRADYIRTRTNDLIASFPTATPEIEAAFPERFTRDAGGRLLRIDARPVNFARADSQELRWGINFSKPVGQQAAASGGPGGWRARAGAAGGAPAAGTSQQPAPAGEAGAQPQSQPGTAPPAPPQGAQGQGPRRQGGGGFGGFGGFGGGRGFGGGGRGGRLQLSLFHTWRLQDEVLIREGVPELDFLGGSASGNRGGRPRHEVELEGGIFRNGLGARVSANWQQGTFVRGAINPLGGTSSDLTFSDIATVNLRLFADLGAQRALVRGNRWLRGTRVTLAVNNLFDSRVRVRDETGATPLSYQPDYLDPLGRSVRLTLRKLFF